MDDATGYPLIPDLVQGHEDAFAALYDRYGSALYRVALGLLGSREEAEDAVQDVFVGLVRSRHTLARVVNPRAYLFAALRHAAAERAVRCNRERRIPLDEVHEPAVSPPRAAANDETVRLEQALRALPPEQRELVVLKVDGGLTFAEVAAVLGISPNTAASRYRYALEKLRAALGECPHVRP